MTTHKEKENDLKPEPISEVVKKMKKEYDKDPKDWWLIGSNDKEGNTDTFVRKSPNAFWLKSKQLSPYSSLSMGSVVRNIDRDIDEQVGQNMKILSPNDMLRFFGMVVPIQQNKSVITAGLEKYSPKQGDYLKKVISEREPNLGYQMAKRIDEEFTKNHPQRKNLYI
ncbi:MAG: hypothetical protein JW891_13370 [Candidatus Lokiarchaeota archaeon]|nr:hypothetical protein [Candidatus Lokiarchaeota archaeon]